MVFGGDSTTSTTSTTTTTTTSITSITSTTFTTTIATIAVTSTAQFKRGPKRNWDLIIMPQKLAVRKHVMPELYIHRIVLVRCILLSWRRPLSQSHDGDMLQQRLGHRQCFCFLSQRSALHSTSS